MKQLRLIDLKWTPLFQACMNEQVLVIEALLKDPRTDMNIRVRYLNIYILNFLFLTISILKIILGKAS